MILGPILGVVPLGTRRCDTGLRRDSADRRETRGRVSGQGRRGRSRAASAATIAPRDRVRSPTISRDEVEAVARIGSYSLDIAAGRWVSSTGLDVIFGIDAAFERSVDGWASLIHADDRDAMVAYFAGDVIGRGLPFDRRYRIVRADTGEARWVYGRGALTLDDDGAPIRMVGTIADITEQVASEEERTRLVEELRRSERDLAEAQRIAHVGSWDRDLATGTLHWSDESHRMFGIEPGTFAGTLAAYLAFVHPDDRTKAAPSLANLEAGEPGATRYRIIRADGALRVLHEESQVIRDADGRPIRYVGSTQDITDLVAAEEERTRLLEELRRSQRNLGEAQRIAGLGSWERDIATSALRFSAEAHRLFGLEPGTIETLDDFLALVHPDDRGKAVVNREVLDAGPRDAREYRIIRTDGVERIIHEEAEAVRDDRGAPVLYVGTLQDITERRAFEEQLRTFAFHDPLTNLANRALFIDRLDQALAGARRRGRSVGVLFLDLDNFKLVNDSLGHGAGDRLLVAVADRFQALVRAEDSVARLGGDEFTILLADVAAEGDATQAASRIEAALLAPFTIDGRELYVSASIGIALGDGQAEGPEALVRNADLAMYRAKLNGKARHEVFEGSMQAGALARIELETDLRHALDRHEFRVDYQPVVSLDDGRIVEVEALIRWQHPVRGLIEPHDFIPVAEETGLIVPIGRWVLEEACRQATRWTRELAAPAISVAVNLSARQFGHPGLLGDIERALREAELPPSRLTLEITESVVMKQPTAAAAKLREIKALGVRIAVDDFGTGYSSLAYLKDFPVDSLKIDGSFTQGLGAQGPDAAIVRSIVVLGHALHLSVTAEGIETPDQLGQLRTIGCDRGQGYLFARPAEADALAPLLTGDVGRWPGRRRGPSTRSALKTGVALRAASGAGGLEHKVRPEARQQPDDEGRARPHRDGQAPRNRHHLVEHEDEGASGEAQEHDREQRRHERVADHAADERGAPADEAGDAQKRPAGAVARRERRGDAEPLGRVMEGEPDHQDEGERGRPRSR